MPFVRVKPDDLGLVGTSVDLMNAAADHDDPGGAPQLVELTAANLRYGWDLEPDERYLYIPDGSSEPVGVLELNLPQRDNLHLVWADITVHPARRRRGYGSAMLQEVLRQAREAGRNTIWLGAAEDDAGARAFAEKFGFVYASHDARRRQRLADVDWAEVERLYQQASQAADDYAVERLVAPVPDEVLAELVAVTAAINDAPMGELTYEDEKFDLQRLKDIEAARVGCGDTMYRVIARHRNTGEVGGHTVVVTNPLRPTWGWQGDTAVAREHRGHRLGLLLKIDMMHWLAEVEPQLETVETFNHADNRYMIDVNEAIGYRLSRVFNTYQLSLS